MSENAQVSRAAYRFFDAGFWLETDSPSFMARFEEAYCRFKVAEAAGAPVYRVMLAAEPAVTIGDQPVHSTDAEALSLYAYNAILNDAAARVQSHFLFHAAALITPGGEGVILAGEAGLGKTTLTLALLLHDFGFLSDDVAAVGRKDGRLYPFPRRLGLRFPGGGPGEKRQLDVKKIASPGPARFLFVLTDPGADLESAPYYLVLDHIPKPLLADLRAVGGVWGAEVARGEPYPAVRLDLAPGALLDVELEVKALCQRRGTLLFEIVQGREAPPDFYAEPRLVSLPVSEAARELVRHFKGGPRSALLQDAFGGSAPRLYLALADLAASMDCYQLDIGRLNSMVETIVSTIECS
jgi:hypothetical protein